MAGLEKKNFGGWMFVEVGLDSVVSGLFRQ